jgi:hypothetical protein
MVSFAKSLCSIYDVMIASPYRFAVPIVAARRPKSAKLAEGAISHDYGALP